jgi:hypothetical protein
MSQRWRSACKARRLVCEEMAHQNARLAHRGSRDWRDHRAEQARVGEPDPTMSVGSRCPPGRALLTRYIHTPARHDIADDLYCRQGGSVEQMAWGNACPMDHESGPSDEATNRVQGGRPPDGFLVVKDLFQSRQAKALDTGTTTGVPGALGRWQDASTTSTRPVVTRVASYCCACHPRSSIQETVSPIFVMERLGSQWRQGHPLIHPHADGRPNHSRMSGVVASTHTKGCAPRCCVQGSVPTTAITIPRKPGRLDLPLWTGECAYGNARVC